MMAGNPNWWSIINGNAQCFPGNPNLSSLISPNYSSHHHQDHFPVRGGGGGEERFQFQQQKKVVENIWMNINNNPSCNNNFPRANNSSSPAIDDNDDDDDDDLKRQIFNYTTTSEIFHPLHPNYSTSTFFNFSGTKTATTTASPPQAQPRKRNHHRQDLQGSEGVQAKKGRVQHSSSAQPSLKVRKEKLGDRITALHQLVSPFGKTDTASVLSEAIASITFLHAQIQALNSPYMRNCNNNNNNNSSSSSSGNSSILHLHHSESEGTGVLADLRSRGLCLVPISCTQNYVTGNYHHHDGGADYWHGGASSAF